MAVLPISISSSNTASVAENGTIVITVVSSGSPPTYTIDGGADAARFNIDSGTGALTFKAAPDFEAPADAGGDNVYNVTVKSVYLARSATQDLIVTVTNVNEAPTITSDGAGATAAVSISENGSAVTTVTAADVDAGATLTYSISGGADAAKFSIDAATGALIFVAAPNFEAPTDTGENNVYDVIVQASDGTLTDTQAIAVTVTDANDAPVITSNGGGATASVSIAENTTAVTTATATDDDASTTLTYSISGGDDASKFDINAATGALSFKTAPNFEAPSDTGQDNVYDVVVQASDGSLADTQAVAVTVTNFDEAAPSIAKVGSEFLVNTQTSSDQQKPTITSLSNGGFVVTWQDYSAIGGDSSGYGIKAQIYEATGTKVGDEFLVNTQTGSSQSSPRITGLSNGGFVVTWQDGSAQGDDTSATGVKAQIYGATGTKVGSEFLVNTETSGSQDQPAITSLANGGFVVTWQDLSGRGGDSSVNGIKAQIYGATGTTVGSEFLVNTQTTRSQRYPTITGLANGGFVVTWQDDSRQGVDTSLTGIKAQIYGATGTKVGSEFLVNTETAGSQTTPTITGLANGGFVVTWTDASGVGGDTEGTGVKAQIYGATGTKVGGEFLVNTQTAGAQDSSSITGLANGGFVVTWRDFSGIGGDTSSGGIKAQVFSADGTKVGSEFLVNTQTSSSQYTPAITGLANGGFVVTWEDLSGLGGDSSSTSIKAQIFSVNEAPIITSDGGGATATVSIAENGSAVSTVQAFDANAGTTFTYSIAGGADALLFSINASTGALTFKSAPNFESPTDEGVNNVYDVIVQVSDGTDTDTQAIAVTVTNANDAPVISSDSGGSTASVSVAENATAVTTVMAADADAGTTLTYSIAGGADAAKFSINASTGALIFVAAPNFEAPTDTGENNVYDVTVQVSDGTLTDTQAITVTVTNVNEASPVISSDSGGSTASLSISENTTSVTSVTATDADAGATLTYSISGGADSSKFDINAATGALSFKTAPNFEVPTDTGANNVYDVTVQVSDGTLTDTQAIAVTVTNTNEAPAITSNDGGSTASVSVAENATSVTTVIATDVDAGTTLTYSITGGDDAALFSIDEATGALSFIAAPNFEAPTDTGGNNVYDVTVQASDGTLIDTQTIAVTVTNANEAPAITSNDGGSSASVSVAENATAVTTVAATDVDAGTTLTYSITGGADAALFSIDEATGALIFVAAPNFESPTDTGGNNVYDVTVQASDGTLIDTQTIAVTVTNANEAPAITSNDGGSTASVSVAENATLFTTVIATDVDAGTTLTYSITGGADAAKFHIDAATGALSFVAAPNFEAPTDTGANNVYDVTVQASDGTLIDTQALAVTVTDANEAPVITSNGGGVTGVVSIAENGTAVTTVIASDPDALSTLRYSFSGGAGAATFSINFSITGVTGALVFNNAPNFEVPTGLYSIVGGADAAKFSINYVTGALVFKYAPNFEVPAERYSIAGGADAAKFSINTSTGALAFKSAPNFEAPTDAGSNNVYDVIVKASDGTLTDAQAIAVTVTDVNNETLAGTSQAATLTGAGGNDTLVGGTGKETLTGGGGDTFVFSAALSANNVDTITDFNFGGRDHIQLSKAVFTAFSHLGALTEDEFYAAAGAKTAHDATDRVIYDTSTGKLYYDADGQGRTAAVQFALIGSTNHPALAFSDIMIIA